MPTRSETARSDVRTSWYGLALLTLVYALNIADRFVLSTLLEPIRLEFALTDSQVGFLTGTALAIFYVTAGIPLGVLADRINRRNMIAVSLAVWSALTVLCGLAQTYMQLLLARIGVGIGEAGGTPASQSLIADRFPAAKRAMATTVFALGASLGSALGSWGAGWLSDHHGWRVALLIFGLAGMPIALILRFTTREPPRGVFDATDAHAEKNTLRATLKFIWKQKSLVHILIGATVLTFWGWGLVWWTPAFLVRSHGMTAGETGSLLGPMHGVGGTLLTLLTIWAMSSRWAGEARRQVQFIAITSLLAIGPSILAYQTQSRPLAEAMLWIFVPATYIYIGPTFALVQSLVLPTMRAQVAAVLVFAANLANLALAPQLIGIASDWTGARLEHPADSLRYVLIVAALTGFWGVYHHFTALKYLKADGK